MQKGNAPGIMIRDAEALKLLGRIEIRDGTIRTEALEQAFRNALTECHDDGATQRLPHDRVSVRTWTL